MPLDMNCNVGTCIKRLNGINNEMNDALAGLLETISKMSRSTKESRFNITMLQEVSPYYGKEVPKEGGSWKECREDVCVCCQDSRA